jgi:predicted ATPase/DNA-binding SARP family transcriptional activator
MRFGVLGPLAAWTSAGEPLSVPGRKVRALLADLLVHAGEPVPADRLIDDLWSAHPPADPAGALQAKVSQLRRALGEAEPGGRDLVAYRPAGYVLTAGPEVDAHQFHVLVSRARAAPDPRARADRLAEALGLWRGSAFADFSDQLFTQSAIARLTEERLTALEDQAETRLELGEHAQLAGELTELVARHPLRERLRAAQLRALYRSGRPAEALDSYRELQKQLTEELGLDPSPELAALQHAILTQDRDLHAPAAPAAGTGRPRSNLPAPLTGLVGRAAAVAGVRARLASARLVTLTGPGGVGKTRLAIEAAAQLAGTFPDGTWLVELAAPGDPGEAPSPGGQAGVAELVSAALGIRDDTVTGDGSPPLAGRLAAALRARELLLVLDNCEYRIEAAAGLAEQLLLAAPGVRILATSREPLAIPGEQLQAVPPLELPAAPGGAGPADVLQASAAQLFAERAAGAAPGFAVDAGNAHAVSVICRRLDGIPLALELAAARVRGLGVHELAARLDDRFRLLDAGRRSAPPRQQTLRAVIDWSWDLASEPERIVLRRLAVHADGCTLASAEETCAGPGVARADVAAVLARLVDRSLVVADGAGEPRYRLLESVAAYSAERLRAAGEEERARRQHRHSYAALADRGRSGLRGSDQQGWLKRLDRERANFRAALDDAIRAAEAPLALRLASAMTWYWFLRGRLAEARGALAAALAVADGPPGPRAVALAWQAGLTLLTGAAGDPDEAARAGMASCADIRDPAARAEAEWFLGFALSDFGDLQPSEDLVSRALLAFRARADQWGLAAAHSTRAKQAAIRGDHLAVRDHGQRSLAAFRALGDRWGQLQATEWLGELCEITGDYEQGTSLHADGLRLAEELGLWPQAADRLSWLGRISMLRGDHAQARQLLERARRLAADQDYQPGEIFAQISLGALARREGRPDLAEALLGEVLAWHRQLGHAADTTQVMIKTELGFAAEQRGDHAVARGFHRDCLAVAEELGDRRAIATALEGLAGARAVAGQHQDAARLLGAAAATRSAAGVPLPPAEGGDVARITAAARTALGDEAFDAHVRRGSQLRPGEAAAGRS